MRPTCTTGAAEELNARSVPAAGWHRLGPTTRGCCSNRDRPGDREEAQRLDGLAQAAAREIGLATLAKRNGIWRSTTLRLWGSSDREAAVWQLSFAGRHAQIPDSRGMHDIAFLLARPGEAVSVLELANESGGAVGAAGRAGARRASAAARFATGCASSTTTKPTPKANGDGERAADRPGAASGPRRSGRP